MNFEAIWQVVRDMRLPTIVGLIVMDVAFGVWSSIKRGEFSWDKVGQFYRTNVIPYLGGYLTVYLTAELVPQVARLISETIKTLLWAPLVANLVASVWGNLKDLNIEPTQ